MPLLPEEQAKDPEQSSGTGPSRVRLSACGPSGTMLNDRVLGSAPKEIRISAKGGSRLFPGYYLDDKG